MPVFAFDIHPVPLTTQNRDWAMRFNGDFATEQEAYAHGVAGTINRMQRYGVLFTFELRQLTGTQTERVTGNFIEQLLGSLEDDVLTDEPYEWDPALTAEENTDAYNAHMYGPQFVSDDPDAAYETAENGQRYRIVHPSRGVHNHEPLTQRDEDNQNYYSGLGV